MKKSIFRKVLSLTLAVSIMCAPSLAMAAPLTDITDEMSTLSDSVVSSHDIRFVTPSGVQYTETIIITFEDFDIGELEVVDVDIAESASAACDTFPTDLTVAASAAPSVWGVATTSSTITFTAPDDTAGEITAGRCMQIQLGSTAALGSNEITNPVSTGNKTIAYTGSFGDTGTSTITILGDDQVAVSAEVLGSITFTLGANTISFGNLDAANDRFANETSGADNEEEAHDFVVGTNASSGYAVTIKGSTLTSGGNTISALGGTASTTNIGTEQFGMRITATGGDGAVSAPYNTANFAYAADISTTDEVATASAATGDTTYSARYVANIASNTEAGSYSTALTYVATANF